MGTSARQYASNLYPQHMGHAMRKRVSGHMRTAKAQFNPHIHTAGSGPSLSANIIIGYC